MKLFLPYYAISIFGLFIASWHFDDDLLKAIIVAQIVSVDRKSVGRERV